VLSSEFWRRLKKAEGSADVPMSMTVNARPETLHLMVSWQEWSRRAATVGVAARESGNQERRSYVWRRT
jgi:hypothetical protein